MVSSKKSSIQTKSKEAGTSKPPSKTKSQNSSRKSEKDDLKRKTKKKNSGKKHTNNGTAKETDLLVISASGSESREDDTDEVRAKTTSKKANSSKSKKMKGNQDENDHEEGEEEAEEKLYKFPVHRIKKIMRDENSDLRINQEALFVVNKATEMFLVQFCKDAYACCAQDRKKSLAYKHLSSVVCKRKRYDFLSDFVPEKLKFEDALRERNMAETGKD